jgi:hypothetical protein
LEESIHRDRNAHKNEEVLLWDQLPVRKEAIRMGKTVPPKVCRRSYENREADQAQALRWEKTKRPAPWGKPALDGRWHEVDERSFLVGVIEP